MTRQIYRQSKEGHIYNFLSIRAEKEVRAQIGKYSKGCSYICVRYLMGFLVSHPFLSSVNMEFTTSDRLPLFCLYTSKQLVIVWYCCFLRWADHLSDSTVHAKISLRFGSYYSSSFLHILSRTQGPNSGFPARWFVCDICATSSLPDQLDFLS